MPRLLLACVGNGAQERRECRPDFACRILHVHAKLGGDHFVAAAAGVQLCAERAQLFDERGFGEMVNVFGFEVIEPRRIGLRAPLDFIERGYETICAFFVREDSRGCNRARPGAVRAQAPAAEAGGRTATTARIRRTKRPGRARSGRPTFSALRKRAHRHSRPRAER